MHGSSWSESVFCPSLWGWRKVPCWLMTDEVVYSCWGGAVVHSCWGGATISSCISLFCRRIDETKLQLEPSYLLMIFPIHLEKEESIGGGTFLSQTILIYIKRHDYCTFFFCKRAKEHFTFLSFTWARAVWIICWFCSKDRLPTGASWSPCNFLIHIHKMDRVSQMAKKFGINFDSSVWVIFKPHPLKQHLPLVLQPSYHRLQFLIIEKFAHISLTNSEMEYVKFQCYILLLISCYFIHCINLTTQQRCACAH